MIPVLRTKLDRQTPFGFSCKQCLQCCTAKKIQVNPYEIARLARNLDISTTAFIARYTVHNGSFLQTTHNKTCLFLGAEGCLVHADRPLVCRLYPLARHVNHKGDEWFSELQPEQGCRGIHKKTGTIENYLEEQGATPYMLAANSYLNLLWEMMTILESTTQDDKDGTEEPENTMVENGQLMDMDAALNIYCQERELRVPRSVEKKMQMHLEALYLWTKEKP
ncbi:YkgJ family cysteine cluster protein [Chlorobium phaeobacteroides]|jgi:hypothetical protein|uniref:YkgJ family cysteine cluster protein n=1 Tax=Chlorobium phaeobacteroides (strain DSM 266 / SMG 266 / 2430) TaxID=290317 RepID=A1BDQ1_CHLPD|nr:YkgJ family cysteine cluster protein [Chlorobium phaeobacteroides]ABL64528.1 protein of unknown function UPF0153 [Chlorobium phaeobacteroides DSM 266]MBV5326573.1 YkgJ family cysteine cluster protein [Chlorobium sp.]